MSGHFAIRAARRVGGFSLVELMVAMAISLVLFAGALAIYFTSRATYTDNDRIARLQETGRIALDLMVRDVRGAGWIGCVRDSEFANDLFGAVIDPGEEVPIRHPDMRWDFSRPVQGYDGNGSNFGAGGVRPGFMAAPLTVGANAPLVSSDVLVIRGPAREGASWDLAAGGIVNREDPIDIEAAPDGMAPGMQPGIDDSVMMITNCRYTSVFRMTNSGGLGTTRIQHQGGAGTPANASNLLSYTFTPRGVVMPLRATVYWVAPTLDATDDPTNTALFRRVNNLPVEELLPGVERMHLLFGEDTPRDGVVDAYRNARNVTDWRNVVAVQISLLIRTPEQDGTLTDSQTYTLLDAPAVGPFNDRRQRLVFNTTATLRNRL